MACAEPQHFRGKPKKRTRVSAPPKGQKGPPSTSQSVGADQSMLVPKPKSTPEDHPHGRQGNDKMRPLRVAKGMGLAALRKAAEHGEGSRGGHIVGHTKSGRAIYRTQSGQRIPKSSHLKYAGLRLKQGHESDAAHSGARGIEVLKHFGHFSAQDHFDASKRHEVAAAEARAQGNKPKSLLRHKAAADGHAAASAMRIHDYVPHQIIGFTGTEKPITASSGLKGDEVYTADHAVRRANPDFTPKDHADAAALHHKLSMDASHPIIQQLHHGAYVAHKDASEGKDFASEFAARLGTDAYKSCSADPLDALRKAAKRGEGSHGGHIIGHTKSGKAIYQDTRADHPAYKGFSKNDHWDAYQTHENRAHKVYLKYAGGKPGVSGDRKDALGEREMAIRDLGSGHFRQAFGLRAEKSLSKATRRGEGSHGGHVIGHTKSGKPIYETHRASSPKYAHFSADDHRDAQRLHADKNRMHAEMAHHYARSQRHPDTEGSLTRQMKNGADADAARHKNLADEHGASARSAEGRI